MAPSTAVSVTNSVAGITTLTVAGMAVAGVQDGASATAIHQMPTVITKPKILVSQPSNIVSVAAANGPVIANGSHGDQKEESKPIVTVVSGQAAQQLQQAGLKTVPAGMTHAQLSAIVAQQQMQPPHSQIAGVNWKTPGATVLPQMSATHAVHMKPEIKSEPPAIQPVVIQPVNPELPKKVVSGDGPSGSMSHSADVMKRPHMDAGAMEMQDVIPDKKPRMESEEEQVSN